MFKLLKRKRKSDRPFDVLKSKDGIEVAIWMSKAQKRGKANYRVTWTRPVVIKGQQRFLRSFRPEDLVGMVKMIRYLMLYFISVGHHIDEEVLTDLGLYAGYLESIETAIAERKSSKYANGVIKEKGI